MMFFFLFISLSVKKLQTLSATPWMLALRMMKKTLTMVDPDLGQSLDIIDVLPGMDQDDPPIAESTCQAQDLPQNLNSSKAVEDNSEQILKLFGTEFAELTSGKDLDEYLAVHSRDRVIVSVEKLLELHGKICSAEHDGQVCGKEIHHSVSLCASRVEISLSHLILLHTNSFPPTYSSLFHTEI